MPNFDSPFLNKTETEIRDWMRTHRHPNFARATFTILDEKTVEKGVCRMGYIGELSPDTRMLRTDFFVDLYIRVAIEECTVDWDDQLLLAEGRVLDRKVLEEAGATGI